jgi:hypothetical protein
MSYENLRQKKLFSKPPSENDFNVMKLLLNRNLLLFDGAFLFALWSQSDYHLVL